MELTIGTERIMIGTESTAEKSLYRRFQSGRAKIPVMQQSPVCNKGCDDLKSGESLDVS
jgi:hypothetical protein